mgnify:FL=1
MPPGSWLSRFYLQMVSIRSLNQSYIYIQTSQHFPNQLPPPLDYTVSLVLPLWRRPGVQQAVGQYNETTHVIMPVRREITTFRKNI